MKAHQELGLRDCYTTGVGMDRSLPAFVHISDYREEGFRNLHRMVAAASPLVVWAPSGLQLDHYAASGDSQINAAQFIELVDEGRVQVVAREHWLTDRKWRDGLEREDLRWHKTFDDALRAIRREDGRRDDDPLARVRIMPPGTGDEFANETVPAPDLPILNNALYRRTLTLYKHGPLPPGTAEKAERRAAAARELGRSRPGRSQRTLDAMANKAAVHAILRDARSHFEAVLISDSLLPYWSANDARFIGLLDNQSLPFSIRGLETPYSAAILPRDALREVLELLDNLERHWPDPTVHIDNFGGLKGFLRSPGRKDFLEWLLPIIDEMRTLDLSSHQVRIFLNTSLRPNVTGGFPRVGRSQAMGIEKGPVLGPVSWADIALTLIQLGLDPKTIMAILPVGLLALAAITRKISTTEYDGINWPFFYLDGERPTPETAGMMKFTVQRILEESSGRGTPF